MTIPTFPRARRAASPAGETPAVSPLRRHASAALFALFAALAWPVVAQQATMAPQKREELHIGFQKSASLLVLQKAQGTLEKRLAPLGIDVKWIEFPAGPQLLEGLNVGAIDVGSVGEAPPIFAQAAGARFVYLGHDPAAPEAEAIVVPKDSPVKTVADLKGRRVALNKGSNVHFLLVRALEKAGLTYADIQPVFLAPADARAAFEKGAVDAWAIWDPFLAAVEKQSGARIVADGRGGVANNFQFLLAERGFVARRPDAVAVFFDDAVERGRWLKANPKAAAAVIAPLQGLDAAVVEQALQRYQFALAPLTPAVVASQQQIADAFFALKLIPKPVRIADALPAAATAATAAVQRVATP